MKLPPIVASAVEPIHSVSRMSASAAAEVVPSGSTGGTICTPGFFPCSLGPNTWCCPDGTSCGLSVNTCVAT